MYAGRGREGRELGFAPWVLPPRLPPRDWRFGRPRCCIVVFARPWVGVSFAMLCVGFLTGSKIWCRWWKSRVVFLLPGIVVGRNEES